jgi:hypothetical protein
VDRIERTVVSSQLRDRPPKLLLSKIQELANFRGLAAQSPDQLPRMGTWFCRAGI